MADNKKVKAVRKLSGIDFSKEGAAVSLVGPSVGGAANGRTTLVMKSLNYSEEFVQKMQQIRVTMELPDFLQKFFGLWYEDAEILARLMGYVEEEDEDKSEDHEKTYEDYLNSKLEAFEVIKSLHEAENIALALSKLSEDDYLAAMKTQEQLEPVLKQAMQGQIPAKEETIKKEKQPMDQDQNVEMVAKSEFAAIQKQLDDQKVELQKALDQIAAYEAEKKEAIRKSRFEQVKSAVKDEAAAEVLFKAVGLLEAEEDFAAVVKALADLQGKVEQSALFQETGASGDAEEKQEESLIAKAVKAQLQQQTK